MKASPGGAALITSHNRIPQRPHTLNRHLHHISSRQRADPSGGTSQDHVAGEQRHDSGNEADNYIKGKDKVSCVSRLPDGAIHARLYLHAGPGISLVAYHRPQWAEGVKALGSRPLIVFSLQIACRHLVGARVAENKAANILIVRQFAASRFDDRSQFALEMDLL